MLHPLRISGYDERNMDFSRALCTAVNDWQIDAWVGPEPRLRASIHVAQDYPEAAVKEIERRADDPRFVQVTCAPQSEAPLGNRRYWPMFAAVCAANRPIALHIGGIPGHPPTGSGWPSYYFEHHFSNVPSVLSVVTSMVLEGVFEEFPKLRVLLVETGFAWAPALCWRLDQHWERMRDEVPHVKRRPSEYVREHFWYSSQPMDEPEHPEHLRDVIDWIGWDRVVFSTDYPHWDFDDPAFAFKFKLSREERRTDLQHQCQGAVRPSLMATARHVVAKVGEIPIGGKKLVSVKGRDIGVFNVNGEFFALLNKCPHAGASLCHGRIIGSRGGR